MFAVFELEYVPESDDILAVFEQNIVLKYAGLLIKHAQFDHCSPRQELQRQQESFRLVCVQMADAAKVCTRGRLLCGSTDHGL